MGWGPPLGCLLPPPLGARWICWILQRRFFGTCFSVSLSVMHVPLIGGILGHMLCSTCRDQALNLIPPRGAVSSEDGEFSKPRKSSPWFPSTLLSYFSLETTTKPSSEPRAISQKENGYSGKEFTALLQHLRAFCLSLPSCSCIYCLPLVECCENWDLVYLCILRTWNGAWPVPRARGC